MLLLPEYLQVERNSRAKNTSGQIEIKVATRRLAASRVAPITATSFHGNKTPMKSHSLFSARTRRRLSGSVSVRVGLTTQTASALTDRSCTHHGDLGGEAHDVAPGVTKDVRQVEDEVDEAAARRRQVGFGEEDANEEALSDGGQAEDQQEHKDERGVAVLEDATILVTQEDRTLPSDQASEDTRSGD